MGVPIKLNIPQPQNNSNSDEDILALKRQKMSIPELLIFTTEHRCSDLYIKVGEQPFISRFGNQQFKRSCLPDGPKTGNISLSPRGDWRMPSDINLTEYDKF